MPTFYVEKKEVWVIQEKVEAGSAEEALREDGNGEIIDDTFEYSHSLPRETWRVYNADGQLVLD